MGCFFVSSNWDLCSLSLQSCMQYDVIMDSVITAANLTSAPVCLPECTKTLKTPRPEQNGPHLAITQHWFR